MACLILVLSRRAKTSKTKFPTTILRQLNPSAKETWDSALSFIKVKGGTEAQKRVFYTAFYRCYERMVDINEYGKYYSNYDKQVHMSDRPFLCR